MRVDQNTSTDIGLNATCLGKLRLWADTNRQDHHICCELTVLQNNPIALNCGNAVVQVQFDPLGFDIAMHICGHIKIQRCNQVIGKLYNRNLQTCHCQVFRHLHTNIATAYNYGAMGICRFHIFLDPYCIRNVAKRKDIW